MKSLGKALTQGLGWLLIGIGGLLFLVGGAAISDFAKVDRIVAEMVGLLLAAACLAVGYALKSYGEDEVAEEQEGSSSEDSSVRK